MRKFVLLAALAATVLPAATAGAQTRELRRDRQELREERRDLRQAQRYGDRRDVRRERRDVRQARRELRQDRREYRRDWRQGEWRDYRRSNRALYARGQWRSPYRYRAFAPGYRLQPGYYSQRYWISDPYRYRLPAAGRNLRWVRFHDDVLLVNVRTGRVVDVQRGFYW